MAKGQGSPRDATLCFLVRGDPPRHVLLGLKKAGFGAAKFTGFGGKVECGETVRHAAVRELEEETGVRASEQDLQLRGHLLFLFPSRPDWSQVVHVFLARAWEGVPRETAEMIPTWFAVDQIPYERMWQDCSHWLPPILGGERIRACFRFREDNETIDRVEIGPWDAANRE